MAQGGRKPRVTDDELLNVFRDADDPTLTSGEVTEQVSIKHSGVNRRLGNLVDEGKLRKKKVGGRSVVYWLPGEDESEPDESAFARELSRKSIANQYGDDWYGQNPDWADGLEDLGENA